MNNNNTSNTYFTADQHFGDKRYALFPRHEGTEELIISNYNKIVNEEDTVWFLGDVATDLASLELVGQMKGNKYLIKGNYDKFEDREYERYFQGIFENRRMTIIDEENLDNNLEAYLVHYPTKAVENRFNLVGHIHGAWRVQKNMINVGVDAWNYNPMSVKDVFFLYNAISKFFDDDVWVANHPANVPYNDRGRKTAAAAGSLK